MEKAAPAASHPQRILSPPMRSRRRRRAKCDEESTEGLHYRLSGRRGFGQ